ncbi:hypothetical protein L6164_003153 [Bauhinia variegata]|uniref:Uncharacterized protein n=1 Tax=Bauhinia variegata TaxID=167791 RepID=A0ACB9Q0D0_BAUVA|nr:hypothetical protein L6164_003153 [Bauhinia variegata]
MEVVSTIVDKLLEYTLIPVTRQVGYVISYKDNVSELKKQAKRLLHERESLQHRVDVAQRNVEEIEGMVYDWLCEVKKNASMAKILLDEDDKRHKGNAEEIEGHDLKWPSDIASKVEEPLDEDDKRSKTAWCSSKSFSSLRWRHQVSRKAKKLAEEIAKIKGEKEFTQVSYRVELNITETWSSLAKNDEAFESRVAALNQITEALADPNLRLIGVHGLGGVGKSTLVRENPKIEKVQQDIADMFGLELKQQCLVVRATLLSQRFVEPKTPRFLKLDHRTGIDTKHFFKSLLDHVEDLHVEGLADLKNVFPNINEKGLIELKHLVVSENCELQFIADLVELKYIIFPKLESLNVFSSKLVKLCNGSITERSFSKLKVVILYDCKEMKRLFSLSLPTCVPHLNEIQVRWCKDLEGVVSDSVKVAGPLQFAELRTLTFEYVPTLIGFYYEDETSSKVQLLRASVAKALAKLHFLSITSCCEFESIVGREEEGADGPINFVFARVTELHLQRLPKLMSFYPGTYSTEWPLLQKFYCESVNRSWNFFGSGLLGFEESHCQKGHEVSIQLSLAVQKSIPMLRELKLDYNKNMMAWIQRYLPDFCWNELKILKLQFFHDVSLWTFIQSMNALETLHVKYGSLEEIFPHEREVIDITQRGRGIHIKTLTIDRLSKLKHIYREGNEPNPILERLEELYISICSGLSNLATSSIKFNHLASIKVSGCNGILHLISSFTAKSLSRLTTIKIKKCKMIKEIVTGKVTDDEITFSGLKTLTLDNLPRLESFCSLNCVLNFPALENVVIKRCPKMKLFSKQAPITKKLRSVKDDHLFGARSHWEDDLNSTVQKLYTDKRIRNKNPQGILDFPELTRLELVDVPKLDHSSVEKIVSEDDFPDVDSESDDEHLNELDQFEVKQEEVVEKHKEHEEEEEEKINRCVTEQSTISYPESRDIDLQTSTNEGITLSTPLLAISQEYQTSGAQYPSYSFGSIKERAEEVAQKDPTARKLELPISPLANEENKASKKLQLLATNSHFSPISRSPPANSYQPLGNVTEASVIAKALRDAKDAIASRLIEFESLVDAMRAELAGIDDMLAKYAHQEELAHNVIGLL